MKRIGVLGLGNIGSGVAKRLINCGYNVNVFDIDQKKMNYLHFLGAKKSRDVVELFEKNECVITSLPNDEIIINTLIRNDQLRLIKSETTLIELSTILPETIKKVYKHFKKSSISVLDCPISGGPKEAAQGSLQLLVAGDHNLVQNCADLFDSLSSQSMFVGDEVGIAKSIKLINNMMTMGNVLIASEAFALGAYYGLDQKMMYKILSQTGGKSHHFVKRFPKVIADNYSAWFSIDLGLKDLKLAIIWAEKQGVNLDITKFVYNNYNQAKVNGLGKKDIVAMTKMFKEKFFSPNS